MCFLKTSFGFNVTEYEDFIIKISNDTAFLEQFAKNFKELIEIENNYLNYTPFRNDKYTFECDKDSDPTVAVSVHKLRPQDIKAVGALGDSLTAAYVANFFALKL